MEAKVFKEHLEKNLIPFWNKLKDEENGGFYGYVGSDGKPDTKSVKGVILNSRILWFYSTAYQLLKKPELLEMADHAYKFLTDFCFDSQYGGVYWSVNYDGTVCDDTKHTYNQSFAIYALSAYYQASGKKDALNMAYVLYRVIEEKCRDENGYLEAFRRDFTPSSNEKLSENGVLAERTMNTLLHVLEAYSELYKADTFYAVGDSIRWILKLFQKKVYNPEKRFAKFSSTATITRLSIWNPTDTILKLHGLLTVDAVFLTMRHIKRKCCLLQMDWQRLHIVTPLTKLSMV